ncbi:MAG: hypothetical protein EPO21_19255 [Chloroflexota bacterium]|nr:MAG: hypothetical protein EPO21_19255 [Chloroflexota bacterium]
MDLASLFPEAYPIALAWRKWFDKGDPPFDSIDALCAWADRFADLVHYEVSRSGSGAFTKVFDRRATAIFGFWDDPERKPLPSRFLWDHADNQMLREIIADRRAIAQALGTSEHSAGQIVLCGGLRRDEHIEALREIAARPKGLVASATVEDVEKLQELERDPLFGAVAYADWLLEENRKKLDRFLGRSPTGKQTSTVSDKGFRSLYLPARPAEVALFVVQHTPVGFGWDIIREIGDRIPIRDNLLFFEAEAQHTGGKLLMEAGVCCLGEDGHPVFVPMSAQVIGYGAQHSELRIVWDAGWVSIASELLSQVQRCWPGVESGDTEERKPAEDGMPDLADAEAKPADQKQKAKARTEPRVPSRRPDFNKWCRAWRLIKPEWHKGKNYTELSAWLMSTHGDLAYSPETIADIIAAGEANKLDQQV